MCDTIVSPLISAGSKGRYIPRPLPDSETRTLLFPEASQSLAYWMGKRFFDLSVAAVALPLILPIILILMVLVKCTSQGSIFYKHLRVGQFGRQFYLFKFRTMSCNSEDMLDRYLAESLEASQEWDRHHKLRRDPRVTPFGALMRRFSLDELPQIVNVFMGQMSFVGPRPIVEEEIQRYSDAFHLYVAVKPGITGAWQVSGRGTLPYEQRVALDSAYVLRWSFRRDLQILWQTPRAVRNSHGAF